MCIGIRGSWKEHIPSEWNSGAEAWREAEHVWRAIHTGWLGAATRQGWLVGKGDLKWP